MRILFFSVCLLLSCEGTVGEPPVVSSERATFELAMGPGLLSLSPEETLKLHVAPSANGLPFTGLYTLRWASSNPEVVSVDPEGVLRGRSPGLATIDVTATRLDTQAQALASVTVLVGQCGTMGPRKVASTPLTAGTVFASPTGAGTSCTLAAPCAAATALSRLEPGDVLFLRGGTYLMSQTNLHVNRSGTATTRITIESFPGERALIDGSALAPRTRTYFVVSANFVTLRNLEVKSMPLTGILVTGSEVVLEGLETHHNRYSGISLYQTARVIVRDCVTHDNSDEGLSMPIYANGGNADGLSMNGGSGHLVDHSLAYGNSDDGFDTWESADAVVRCSVAHHHGLGQGDGNGFKGGGPIGKNARFEYDVAFQNKAAGFNFNAGTGVLFNHLTSWQNGWGFSAGNDTRLDSNISVGDARLIIGTGVSTNNAWQRAGSVAFASTGWGDPGFLVPNVGFVDVGAFAP